MELIIELIKLASVGIIASAFTSYLANRDHRQKKWWELRVQAYKEAIEALSEILHFFDEHYNAEVEKKDLNEETLAMLNSKWKAGYSNVRLAADAGAFLFSAEAEKALRDYISEVETRYTTFFDYLDAGWVSTDKCLKKIVKYSKKDLQLKKAFYDRA